MHHKEIKSFNDLRIYALLQIRIFSGFVEILVNIFKILRFFVTRPSLKLENVSSQVIQSNKVVLSARFDH